MLVFERSRRRQRVRECQRGARVQTYVGGEKEDNDNEYRNRESKCEGQSISSRKVGNLYWLRRASCRSPPYAAHCPLFHPRVLTNICNAPIRSVTKGSPSICLPGTLPTQQSSLSRFSPFFQQPSPFSNPHEHHVIEVEDDGVNHQARYHGAKQRQVKQHRDRSRRKYQQWDKIEGCQREPKVRLA